MGWDCLILHEALKPYDKKGQKAVEEFVDFNGLSEEEINAILDEKS